MNEKKFTELIQEIVKTKYPDMVAIWEDVTGQKFENAQGLGFNAQIEMLNNAINQNAEQSNLNFNRIDEIVGNLQQNDDALSMHSIEASVSAIMIGLLHRMPTTGEVLNYKKMVLDNTYSFSDLYSQIKSDYILLGILDDDGVLINDPYQEVSTVNPFAGINISFRGYKVPDGYTVTYDPATKPTVDTTTTYTVVATLVHLGSSQSRAYTFQETQYPDSVDVDNYGRKFIDMDSVPDSECKTFKLSEGGRFVEAKADDPIDTMIYTAFSEVLGRDYLGSGGVAYWYEQTLMYGWDLDTLKLAIANGAINAEGVDCPLAKLSAETWLATHYPDLAEEQQEDFEVTSRSWFRDGYSILFNPENRREGYYNSNYPVTYTIINDTTKKETSGTFTESYLVIDPFADVNVFTRGAEPLTGFTTVYDPENPNAQTGVSQSYNVTATVTHLDSNLTKEYTFIETIEPLDAPTTADGRFDLYTTAELASVARGSGDPECEDISSTGVFVKVNESDTKQVKIRNAFSTVLDRNLLDSDGFAYWYDDSTIEQSQLDFNVTIASGALGFNGCPTARFNAKSYLESLGWTVNGTEVFKVEQKYTKIADAYTRTSQGDPIYETNLVDYSVNFTRGVCTQTGALGDNGTPERRQNIINMYQKILKRDPEPSGLDYWLNDSIIMTKEELCQAFQSALDQYQYYSKWWAAYVELGNITGDEFVTGLTSQIQPADALYIVEEQKIVGYQQIVTNYPAEYGYVDHKVYLRH